MTRCPSKPQVVRWAAVLVMVGLLLTLTPPAILLTVGADVTAGWSDYQWLAMGATAYLGASVLGWGAIEMLGDEPSGGSNRRQRP